jgi:cyclopropane fatty-acyl-phospholipid synthase-like methyltransferase
MATAKDIQHTYDVVHPAWIYAVKTWKELTCARWKTSGQTFRQAQDEKHRWIIEKLHLKKGGRYFDIGCGYGGLMEAAAKKGIDSIGVTLSKAQEAYGKKAGLDIRNQDWKKIKKGEFKDHSFDAAACVEAVEHFCPIETALAGKQDELYARFFQLVRRFMKKGGRFYYQGMVWGPNVDWNVRRRFTKKDRAKITFRSQKLSTPRLLNAIQYFFPGSFLPYGGDYFSKIAEKNGFVTEYTEDGTNDYIRTAAEWYKAHVQSRWWLKPQFWPHYLGEFAQRPKQMLGWLEYVFSGAQMWVFIFRQFELQRTVYRAV